MPELTAVDIYKNPDSFTTSLVLVTIDAFTTDAANWHPVVLREQIENRYSIKDLPAINFDKVVAGLHVISHDDFTWNTFVFNIFCHIFNNVEMDLETALPVPDPYILAWGVAEGSILAHDSLAPAYKFLKQPVLDLIDATMSFNGLGLFPPILRISPDASKTLLKPENIDASLIQDVLKVQFRYLNDINEYLLTKLSGLLNELAQLRLTHGSTEPLIAQIIESKNWLTRLPDSSKLSLHKE
jgi:hypothetical protein